MSINVNDKNLGHATAYAYYKAGGGTMTEAEFIEFMADFGTASQTAVEAAQAALASKNAAQTAATTATNKASEATTAAQTATTKAAEAQADADAAALDASQALSAASTATSKATEATTAAATATSAKTDAVAANTAAQSAKTAAQTAQTGAETAAASVQSSAAQIATNTEDITQLKSDLTTFESDGAVPSAEQILTDKGVTDCVPYHYRKTGGDGADRLCDQIVGATANWNQMVKQLDSGDWSSESGVTATFDNGVATISSSVSGNGLLHRIQIPILAHKYFVTMSVYGASGQTVAISGIPATLHITIDHIISNANTWETHSRIVESGLSDNMRFYALCRGGTYENIKIKDIMLIDLTAMFGTEIADYIYNLETSHAGDGVAFFKSLFPNDYYPYNSGELVSVSGLSEHKMVGFNQWDEEWEVGAINYATGKTEVGTNRFRSKNYISLLPNTQYYAYVANLVSNDFRMFYYDADFNFIGLGPWQYSAVFTTPQNTRYGKFIRVNSETYNHDICINISDPAKNGTYEPYKAHSYPLDSTLTLRGLFKLDANNKLYADGDTYDADGKVTRKYGVVDLGTLNWAKSTDYTNPIFYASISDIITGVQDKKLMCPRFIYVVGTNAGSIANHTTPVIGTPTTNNQVIVRDPNYDSSDAATFKAAMSGVYLVYRLATPTTEQATPYQHLQQCDPNGTEEYVSTGIVPVGHNSFYPENLKAKVEGLPWNFASLIAPTEATFTATRNYTTGALFIVSNVLYKATSNIANGGTITPNTNCTATTLAEIISALA